MYTESFDHNFHSTSYFIKPVLILVEVRSYEEFTVGAIANNGLAKLELDLNNDHISPSDYRYFEESRTIDQITNQIALLEKEIKSLESSPYHQSR